MQQHCDVVMDYCKARVVLDKMQRCPGIIFVPLAVGQSIIMVLYSQVRYPISSYIYCISSQTLYCNMKNYSKEVVLALTCSRSHVCTHDACMKCALHTMDLCTIYQVINNAPIHENTLHNKCICQLTETHLSAEYQVYQ